MDADLLKALRMLDHLVDQITLLLTQIVSEPTLLGRVDPAGAHRMITAFQEDLDDIAGIIERVTWAGQPLKQDEALPMEGAGPA